MEIILIKIKPYPDWKFSIKHLYSLVHFYEMKINLFDEYDENIYAHMKKFTMLPFLTS